MTHTAILDIQDGCNLACVFCLEDDANRPTIANPAVSDVHKLLDDLYERGARNITFMGGETFFRKDLGTIIRDARRLGYTRIGVTTNGTILSTPNFLRRQVEAGLDFIEFSLHGHTPELANAIGRRPYTFSRQATALAQINELALPTIFNVVICEENKDHLIDLARYVMESFPRIPAHFKFKFVALQGRAASEARKNGTSLRYEDVDAVALGDFLAAHNLDYWFWNFPLCRLGDHVGASHELNMMASDEQFFDLVRPDNEYEPTGYQLAGFVRPERTCATCTLRAICPGLGPGYVELGAESALHARQDDPLPFLELVLRRRFLDPASAPVRLAHLTTRPDVPAQVRAKLPHQVEVRPLQLLFSHAAVPRPLELFVTAAAPGRRAFFRTPHFALSYASWPGADPFKDANVSLVLAAATRAIEDADAAGAPIESARGAVVRAAEDCGWQAVESPMPTQAAQFPANSGQVAAC